MWKKKFHKSQWNWHFFYQVFLINQECLTFFFCIKKKNASSQKSIHIGQIRRMKKKSMIVWQNLYEFNIHSLAWYTTVRQSNFYEICFFLVSNFQWICHIKCECKKRENYYHPYLANYKSSFHNICYCLNINVPKCNFSYFGIFNIKNLKNIFVPLNRSVKQKWYYH